MRAETNAHKLEELMELLGRYAKGPGNVYFTGGATAILRGWRETSVDADLKLDPEPPAVFEAIARVKEELDINVELASPDLFIPPLPGWRERSQWIGQRGEVRFFHYDFYAQALAKIERGHQRDLDDASAMVRDGLVMPAVLRQLYDAIEGELTRYPAITPAAFRAKLEAFLRSMQGSA